MKGTCTRETCKYFNSELGDSPCMMCTEYSEKNRVIKNYYTFKEERRYFLILGGEEVECSTLEQVREAIEKYSSEHEIIDRIPVMKINKRSQVRLLAKRVMYETYKGDFRRGRIKFVSPVYPVACTCCSKLGKCNIGFTDNTVCSGFVER